VFIVHTLDRDRLVMVKVILNRVK